MQNCVTLTGGDLVRNRHESTILLITSPRLQVEALCSNATLLLALQNNTFFGGRKGDPTRTQNEPTSLATLRESECVNHVTGLGPRNLMRRTGLARHGMN